MIIQSNGQELQDFKVRLENILLMTDLKEPSNIIVSIIPDFDQKINIDGYKARKNKYHCSIFAQN